MAIDFKSILEHCNVERHYIEPTDIYHAAHPLHHLVLDEIEEYDQAMEDYEHSDCFNCWNCDCTNGS